MKVILFAFFFALLATSSAVTLKARSKAVLKALSQNLGTGSPFKKAFRSLLELTQDDEYQQVADILDRVRDEIAALLNDKQGNLDGENTAYSNQRQTYEDTINDITRQMTKTQQDLDANQANRQNIQDTIQNAGSAISEAVSARDAELARRSTASQTFESNLKAIDDARAQCDQAIALLQQVQAEDLPAGSSTFLEVQRKKLHKSLMLIQQKIEKINLKSPVAPFIKTLISIAQDTVNQDAIAQIISLIQDLKNSLQNERNSLVSADQDDQDSSANIVANLESTISSQQTALQNSQDALAQVTALIDTETNQLESLQQTLQNANDQVSALDASHATKASSLQGYIDRLKKDIEAIDQALDYLNSQRSS